MICFTEPADLNAEMRAIQRDFNNYCGIIRRELTPVGRDAFAAMSLLYCRIADADRQAKDQGQEVYLSPATRFDVAAASVITDPVST